MNNFLSLTQRQTCEKLAESMNWNNLKVSGLQAFLTAIMLDDFDTITVDDLIKFGVIEENKGFSATSWVSDPTLNGNFLESKAIKFFARNPSYTNESNFTTIMDAINTSTIAEFTGTPIMAQANYEGFTDLVSYIKSRFNFGTSFQEADLCFQIGNQIIEVCHLIIDNGVVSITRLNGDLTYAYQQLGIACAGTKMLVDLCQGLADGLHSPADLLAILNHYTKSSCASISSFAQNVLRKGRESIRNAIFEIVSLFRETFGNYQEDSDGNIKWEINSQRVSSNFWLVARNILIGGGQMLGTMLLFAGNVVAKVIGGIVLVGASVLQAITTFTGSIAGTNPCINDDAIDACYHDPIAQQDDQDISSFNFSPDLEEELIWYKRAKIVCPSFVLYLYNYKAEEHTVSWKLFANVTSTCPGVNIGYSKSNANVPGNEDHSIYISDVTSRYTHEYFSWATFGNDAQASCWWSFSINRNNNKGVEYNQSHYQTEETDITPQTFTDYVYKCMNSQSNKDGVDLSTNSPDADAWKKLWHILKDNVLQTLSYVFCNSMYYEYLIQPVTVNSSSTSVYKNPITDIVKYDITLNNTNSNKIVNAIVTLSEIDHSHDNFLYALLGTIGLITNEPEEIDIYNYYISTGSGGIPMGLSSELYENFATAKQNYLYDYTGIFAFMSIDPYAYVTPQTSSFKSIIYGALVATLMVAAVVAGTIALRSFIVKKVQFKMQALGQDLLEQGETFRNGFSPDEIKQLSPSDQKIYYNAFKKYKLKVTLYNLASSILGLSSLDWINNWWNPYQADSEFESPVVTEISPDSIEATSDVIDSVGSLYRYTTDPEYYAENPTDSIILYRLISGRNPSYN